MSNIVYVDDEHELNEIFRLCFQDSGHQVMTFTDEQKALNYCKQTPPDILFIDYNLKNMKGDDIARELPNNIIKILVTGNFSVDSDVVFDEIISKPFKIAELLAVVDRFNGN